ncbi:MAG: carboxylesterase/lipase family protein [Pirellulales bacterium]
MWRKSYLLTIMLAALVATAQAKDSATDAASSADVLKVTADTVKLAEGEVRGLVTGDENEVHVYRGIPFAAPPVGELRWRPPQPPASWSGVRECYEFGAAAPQKPSPMLATFPGMKLEAPTNEDCLYLNVWTPAKRAEQPLPVMVWIHGGGYVMGAASQRMYDATDLARRGVIVVGINYRLGALGFLAHPELTAESEHKSSGNYGLLDQIEALRWVQGNIAAFGGDPQRVTIFGESAGGGSVFSLLVSPLAKGLFQRAIAESGPTLNFVHLNRSHYGFPSAEELGLELGKAVGSPEGTGQIAAMRKLTADEVIAATPGMEEQRDFTIRGNLLRMAPVVDGWVIPDDPMTILAEGRQNDVPLIVGANRDEGTMFTLMAKLPRSLDDLRAKFVENLGETHAAVIGELYPAASVPQVRRAVTDFIGDFIFVAPARYVARHASKKSSPVYLYHFAHPPAGGSGKMLGAHHAAEVPYVFDNIELGGPNPPEVDQQLRDAMVGYWLQFAATGNPNGEGLLEWPAYDTDSDRSLLVEEAVSIAEGLRKPKLDAIDAFMDSWRRESGVVKP